MDDKLSKLVDNNSENFNDWIKIINDHNSMFNPEKKLSQDEQSDLVFKTVDVLAQIAEIFFKYGSFKDTFDTSKMHLNVYGLNLIIKSTKTENQFNFGIDNKGIYLDTYLRHSENLRHMDDSFYKDIFLLMDLGDFELQENQFYNKQTTNKYTLLYNNKKSKIFRLLRNYIVGTAENERDILLGNFLIQWSYDNDFYDIIYNGCLAFKTFYKLNYSLWKINDIEKKKN
jgi:hypothetical protein